MVKIKSKKQALELQIAAYSVLAAGFMANPHQAEAQILYTDLYEDVIKGDTSSFIFDINGDSYHDLMVFSGLHDNGKVISMQLGDSVEVMGSSQGNYFYPFALDFGFSIDGNNANWRDVDFGTMNWQGIYDYGNWQGVEDKFVAMKIILNGESYFGWARLDVDAEADQFTVKDFACEFRPGVAIVTGVAYNTYGVTELSALDIADNGNPSDMQLSFRKAADESKISEYRIVIVKANDPIQITPHVASSIPIANSIKVDKTGNDILLSLPSDAKDKDGDLITHGIAYKVYVLSVPDGVNATDPILSANQEYVILNTASSATGKPSVEDIGDNKNGSDIQVSFEKGTDESKVDLYRIFIVKTEKVNDFTIEVAKTCGPAKYFNAPKTGNDLVAILDAAIKDTDGEFIKENTNYHAYVMSIADGINASENVLSQPSDVFELTSEVNIQEYISEGFNPYNLNYKLYIGSEINIPNGSQLQVFSTDGKLQLQQVLAKEMNEIYHSLNNGIYIVILQTPEREYHSKIIISN